MTNFRLLSKTLVKRETAAAITAAQARNGWSNEEAGAALGCCGNTIRNRVDVDDPGKQMTVYELLRSLAADAMIARHLLALAGFEPRPLEPAEDNTTDRAKESVILKAALALSVALEDDGLITPDEILANRATIENARDALDGLLASLAPRRQA